METEFRIGDYVQILKQRYLFLLIPFVVLFSASVAVATLLPPLYQSKGVILIESPQISREIVAGAIDSAARERIEVIKQRVMTRANLIRIANEFNVFRDAEKKLSSTEIVEAIRSAASVEFVSTGATRQRQTTIAFTVSFQHRSPQTAARVANEIVTLFMDENVKTRTQIATETTDFLNQEAKKLEDHLAEIEAKIANYKQENATALPESMDIRMSMRERTETNIRETTREIRAHEEELRFLDIQLAALKSGYNQISVPMPQIPVAPIQRQAEPQYALPENPELEKLRNEYKDATYKYAPSHPDVKRLKRELETLEQRLIDDGGPAGIGVQISRLETDLKAANEAGNSAEADRISAEIEELKEKLLIKAESTVVDTNYLRQKQQAELAQAQAKAQEQQRKAELDLNVASVEAKIAVTNERISSLEQQKKDLQARLEEIEQTIVQTPLVDRALKSLNRDYANAQLKYNEVRAKAMEAQIAENVEEASKAERFVLVEPPTLPDAPIKPNRVQLVLMGFALSIGVGAASIFGIEFIDGSIRGVGGVMAVTNMVPLATIPYIVTAEEERGRRKRLLFMLIGGVAVLFVGLAGVHTLYKPLDEVVYKVIDRFN